MLQRTLNRVRIQYASDLHLEFYKSPPSFQKLLKPVAPLLALAGDIGSPQFPHYTEFLRYCSEHWESVFVVAGNHEFYRRTYQHNLQLCGEVASQFPNVHFLHRGRVELPQYGVTVLGATLWSDVGTPYRQEVAKDVLSDYRYIAVEKEEIGEERQVRPLEPSDTDRWHHEDAAWLHREIQENASIGRPVIVITHHLPTYQLISARYQQSPINFCFASDCRHLLRDPVRAWICGHTHTAMNYTAETRRGHILLGVNPRGYPNETTHSGYCAEIFMDISTEPVPVDERDPLLIKSGLYDHPTADVGRLGEESSYELGSQTPAGQSQNSVTEETLSDVSFE